VRILLLVESVVALVFIVVVLVVSACIAVNPNLSFKSARSDLSLDGQAGEAPDDPIQSAVFTDFSGAPTTSRSRSDRGPVDATKRSD
jgi:hypothetical protein